MPSRPSRVSRRRSNKKWCPVLESADLTIPVSANAQVVNTQTLAQNSSNASTAPTSTIIKCGNFKCVVDVNITSAFNGSGRLYIMFVPQSVSIGGTDTGFVKAHPEWIMCWRGFEPGTNGLQAVSMQSKLKRNLNSGDRIVLVSEIFNYASTSSTAVMHITCSYVCCNN